MSRRGNRYVAPAPGPGGVRIGDFVQFGCEEGGEFDPDLIDYTWGGEAGVAIYMDGLIRWPDGQISETSVDPAKPTRAVDIIWRGERTTWRMEGEPEEVKYEPVEDVVVSSDPQRRTVMLTVGTKRMTMSPEKAEELMRRLAYHVGSAKGVPGSKWAQ